MKKKVGTARFRTRNECQKLQSARLKRCLQWEFKP